MRKIKKEKKSSKIIILELFFLIISMILVCLVIGKIENIGKKKNDEFSIIYEDNKNIVIENGGVIILKPDNTSITEKDVKSETLGKSRKSKNSKKDNNIKNENIYETNTYEPEVIASYWVEDKKIVWENNSVLGIFDNSKYMIDNLIAPGSTNTYTFYVNNKIGFNLNYIMSFTEENTMKVNMMYRLKKGNEYIAGDENTWEYCDKLYIDTDIENDGKDKYILEWKWVDADNDTEVGVNYAKGIYKLKINILATQIL